MSLSLARAQVAALSTLAVEIRAEHEACEQDARSAVEHAIRAGELLAEAKTKLRHGEWLPWLKKNFPASERTAQAYMRLAANPQTSADFDSVDAALAELAEPRAATADPVTFTGLPDPLPPEAGADLRASVERATAAEPDDAEVVTGEVVPEPPAPEPRLCPTCGHRLPASAQIRVPRRRSP